MSEYYFVATALPSITWGKSPEITLHEYLFFLKDNLSECDRLFLDHYDNEGGLPHFLSLFEFSANAPIDNKKLSRALCCPTLPSFLRSYLAFEKRLRFVLVGLRAKQLGRNLTTELQHEDPHDELVTELLTQQKAKNYAPPEPFEPLSDLFECLFDQPLALHEALCRFRFIAVEEMMGFDLFSIDYLLGYLIQLLLTTHWMELDRQTGMALLDTLLKETA